MVPGHGHQFEHSLLLVPEHKFRHRPLARALAPEVVLGHRARARARAEEGVLGHRAEQGHYSEQVFVSAHCIRFLTSCWRTNYKFVADFAIVNTFSYVFMRNFSSGHWRV